MDTTSNFAVRDMKKLTADKPKKTELEWLRSVITPLSSVEMTHNDKDLTPIKELVRNSRVVALGESSHGSSEIFKMKDRIIKYLVENAGFNVFAIEANMTRAYKLNDYIVNGEGDPKELIKGMFFWTWDTQEMLDLVVWMKKYNDAHQRKVIFTGFDMQEYEGPLPEIKDLLRKYDIRYSFDELERELKNLNGRRQASGRAYNANITGGEKLKIEISHLQQSVAKMIPAEDDREWFIQNVRLLKQFSELGFDRDKNMAENFLWTFNNSDKSSKFIIWAHNWHIKKNGNVMGAYLLKDLKKDYFACGFAFHKGSYTAYDYEIKKVARRKAQTSYPGTYEYYFHRIGERIFLINFGNMTDIPQSRWLRRDMLFRHTGSTKIKEEFGIDNLLKDFDALIYIDKSTSSTLLHHKVP